MGIKRLRHIFSSLVIEAINAIEFFRLLTFMRVRSELVVLPEAWPEPDINHLSRCDLEVLCGDALECKGYAIREDPVFVERVMAALKKCVVLERGVTHFDLGELNGVTAGKLLKGRPPDKRDLVDAGSEIVDLTDLEGLGHKEEMDRCIEHCIKGSYNQKKGMLSVCYYSWHRRYYWINSDGSHHMARLCFLSEEFGLKVIKKVCLTSYFLDPDAINEISKAVAFFLVSKTELNMLDPRKTFSGGGIDNFEFSILSQSYGVYFFDGPKNGSKLKDWGYQSFFDLYWLVVIDLSKPKSRGVLWVLEEAAKKGRAISLADYLKMWKKMGNSSAVGYESDCIRER